MNTYFTADSHYSHKNICTATSEWADAKANGRTRDFKSIEEMNQAIVDGINNTVGENDILYHMGDWSFGGKENIEKFRFLIKCKNIHFTFGNHDHHIKKNKWYRELFLSTQERMEIKIDDQMIVLDHYSMRVWNKYHKGSWQLYGHSHGSLPESDNKSIDVGIDAAFLRVGEYRPYSFDELVLIMAKKEVNIVDHHKAGHAK